MGRENSLPLCSLEGQHFHACELGSGCEQQGIPVGAPGLAAVHAAVPGLTSARGEKMFLSQESQAVLWWVFGGTELGREEHLSPPLLPGKPTQLVSVCSAVKQLVQASVEVLCV